MKGALHRFSLEGRPCACFAPQAEGEFPLLVLCGWGMEEKLPSLSQELPPALLFFAQAEGDRDFTPWPAPGVREGEAFTGEAGAYLEFLTETALPYLEREYGASPGRRGGGFWATPWAGCSPCGLRPRAEPFRRQGPCPAPCGTRAGWIHGTAPAPAGGVRLPVPGGPGGVRRAAFAPHRGGLHPPGPRLL